MVKNAYTFIIANFRRRSRGFTKFHLFMTEIVKSVINPENPGIPAAMANNLPKVRKIFLSFRAGTRYNRDTNEAKGAFV